MFLILLLCSMKRVWQKTEQKRPSLVLLGLTEASAPGALALRSPEQPARTRASPASAQITSGHSAFFIARGDELTAQRPRLLQGTKATSAGSGAS